MQCKVEGCNNPVRALGLCAAHHQSKEFRDVITHQKHPTECSVEGCPYPGPYVKGLCRKHYKHFKRHGTPEKPKAEAPKESSDPAKEEKRVEMIVAEGQSLKWLQKVGLASKIITQEDVEKLLENDKQFRKEFIKEYTKLTMNLVTNKQRVDASKEIAAANRNQQQGMLGHVTNVFIIDGFRVSERKEIDVTPKDMLAAPVEDGKFELEGLGVADA